MNKGVPGFKVICDESNNPPHTIARQELHISIELTDPELIRAYHESVVDNAYCSLLYNLRMRK